MPKATMAPAPIGMSSTRGVLPNPCMTSNNPPSLSRIDGSTKSCASIIAAALVSTAWSDGSSVESGAEADTETRRTCELRADGGKPPLVHEWQETTRERSCVTLNM